MISKDKTYRTRDGREVRIYATDGSDIRPVHGAIKWPGGWVASSWNQYGSCGIGPDSQDLIEADPHGILPRHRELLATCVEQETMEPYTLPSCSAHMIRNGEIDAMPASARAALIALAKLDAEKSA